MKSAIQTTITLILSLVIAQHQTFANHEQAPSRNLFPVFYNSLMSYMIAIYFWLWSYCFLQYFLPSEIKSLCKLNQSFLNKTQEDSHNDDAHLCSFICRCTSLAISPATLQWLRLRMGTVQGGGSPSLWEMPEVRFKIQHLLTWAHSTTQNSPKTHGSTC